MKKENAPRAVFGIDARQVGKVEVYNLDLTDLACATAQQSAKFDLGGSVAQSRSISKTKVQRKKNHGQHRHP